MKLSTRSRYGTRAMIDIALYSQAGATQLKDISHRQSISAKYLDHILSALKKAGLIKNIRGRQGGYLLAKPASQITLKEVVYVLEGSLALVDCVDNPAVCPKNLICSSRDVWGKLKAEMEKVLDSITLQDLIDSHQEKERPSLHYCI